MAAPFRPLHRLPPRAAAALLLTLSVAACGGEDGGGGPGGTGTDGAVLGDAPPPAPTDGSVLDQFFVESFAGFEAAARQLIEQDPRYLFQRRTWYFDDNGNGQRDPATEPSYSTYPLHSSGVAYAHAAGLTGAGQVIAITDDGFLPGHEAFAGKEIAQAGEIPVSDHGTLVASVAAGSSEKMIGMAPGADLALGSFETFQSLAVASRQAEALGAVAQNNSWGFIDTPVGQGSYDRIFSSAASRDYLGALRSYAETGVVVFAISNDAEDTRADLMVALPALEPGLEASWIAAMNADAEMSGDDVVAARRISAPCNEAARWCLAAEGSWFGATSGGTDSYGFKTGSSFAAPMVAGAMAILGEAFPQLSPQDLRIRLLASADNDFDGFSAAGEIELAEGFSHAFSTEWGHGFLDVKAALLPIGGATATLADGSVHDVSRPLAIEGGATGDAVTRALAEVTLVAEDALRAPFPVPADRLVAAPAPPPVTEALYRDWQSGGLTGCCGIASYFPDARVASAGAEGLTVSLAMPAEGASDASYSLGLGRRFQSDIGEISVSLGFGRDAGALLPRWDDGSAGTVVAGGIDLTTPLGDDLSFQIGAGWGSADGTGNGPARLSSARAALVTRDVFAGGDRLSVSVGLPVAVTSGRTTVTLPVQTLDGTAEQRAIAVDLEPESREVRLEVSYEFALSERSDMVLSAAHAEDFGNVTGQRDSGLFFGIRTRF